jgi:hypothetical protein
MKLLADENFPAPAIASLRERGQVFHRRHSTPPGVVLFRLTGATPADDNRRILEVLERLDEWHGRFTTITDTLIRCRSFPHHSE